MPVRITSGGKLLRSPQFSARLQAACDAHASCPLLNKGRLTWLQAQLREQGLLVSVEAVRKWLSGEGRPRQDTCEKLAAVLQTDAVELYMGCGSALPITNAADIMPAEQILPIAVRDGVVVRITGLPLDLTTSEATRIANIVKAHALVEPD
jgi:hypothetical protein